MFPQFHQAYLNIFKRLGINIIKTISDSGTIGGNKSEEFQAITNLGEDTILYDPETRIALNTEILERENYEEYLEKEYGITDISRLEKRKAIELGHIFQLGTKYSETMNGYFVDQEGKQVPYYMGCFGIGVSRTVAAIYEQNVLKDKSGNYCG